MPEKKRIILKIVIIAVLLLGGAGTALLAWQRRTLPRQGQAALEDKELSLREAVGGSVSLKDADVGDIVLLGRYEQDNRPDNGAEPLAWYVLDKEGGEAALLCVYALEVKQFDSVEVGMRWESSSLRKWLNRDFYDAAFNRDEQASILMTDTANQKITGTKVVDGRMTRDKVWLLSKEEIEEYFEYDAAENRLTGFDMGIAAGLWEKDASVELDEYSELRWDWKAEDADIVWWLRSPGAGREEVAIVREKASGSALDGDWNIRHLAFVRPAIKVMVDGGDIIEGQPASGAAEPPASEEETALAKASMEGNRDFGGTQAPEEGSVLAQTAPEGKKETGGEQIPAGEEGDVLEQSSPEETKTSDDAQSAAAQEYGMVRRFASARAGDVVLFGEYEQDGNAANGAEPVAWYVLKKDAQEAMLLCVSGLEAKQYDPEGKDVSWRKSALRSWLNRDFYHAAFNEAEQSFILFSDFSDNDRNGKELHTREYVSLLSKEEFEDSFEFGPADGNYRGYPFYMTDAARASLAQCEAVITDGEGNYNYYSWKNTDSLAAWWLRSGSEYDSYAGCVLSDGGAFLLDDAAPQDACLVRPVIRVRCSERKVVTADTLEEASPGDVLLFGKNTQESGLGAAGEAMEWYVLGMEEGEAFLVSAKSLDAGEFLPELGTFWGDCGLRSWLNGEFYNTCFDEEERGRMLSDHGDIGVWDEWENDKVSLLSAVEFEKYMDRDGYDFYSECIVDYKVVSYEGMGSLAVPCLVRPAIKLSYSYKDELPGSRLASLQGAKVGDVVTFGRYEQDGDMDNGQEPIKWYVLEKKDGEALLLSASCLDIQNYHTENNAVSWADCSLRNWLNQEFYDTAFNRSEQNCIVKAHLLNQDNPVYGTEGGKDTLDKVWLLSLEDVQEYLGVRQGEYEEWALNGNYADEDEEYAAYLVYSRRCYERNHLLAGRGEGAIKQYAMDISGADDQRKYIDADWSYVVGNCWWWLRSPGSSAGKAAFVNCAGGAAYDGTECNYVYECFAVRPALKVAY